jgi:molecular chaperone GrpE (heat shock protein)
LNDEYLEKKIEFGREFALSNQQNEFQTKKIEDLQSQLQNITERYEEKLSNFLNFASFFNK